MYSFTYVGFRKIALQRYTSKVAHHQTEVVVCSPERRRCPALVVKLDCDLQNHFGWFSRSGAKNFLMLLRLPILLSLILRTP